MTREFIRVRSLIVLLLPAILAAAVVSCSDSSSPVDTSRTESDGGGSSALGDLPPVDPRFHGGLVGSKHDFSQSGSQPADLCLSCHSPHIAGLSAPLLDRRPATTQPIQPYKSVGLELNSASLLCLSCHNGIIAKDVFTNAHASRLVQQFGVSQLGSRNPSGHPIGVKFPISEPTFHTISQVRSDGRIKLPDGRVQCISCHDPHNTERHPSMLVKSNSGSRLCLSCHRL